MRHAEFFVTAVLAAILWRRARWTYGQLRLMELLLFGSLAVLFLGQNFLLFWGQPTLLHAVELTAQGQETRASGIVTGVNHNTYMPSALLNIAYGIFIPNHWPRCDLVVGTMTLAPVGLRTVAYVTSGLPMDDWSMLAGINGGLLLLTAVAIAIYGAHRIEALRQEAMEARKVGQYQLEELLGVGGMGEVYLAEHLLLRRPCAIKLIRSDLLPGATSREWRSHLERPTSRSNAPVTGGQSPSSLFRRQTGALCSHRGSPLAQRAIG